MTRETKVGIVISCSFLALIGVVIASRWRDQSTTNPTPDNQTVKASPVAFPSKPFEGTWKQKKKESPADIGRPTRSNKQNYWTRLFKDEPIQVADSTLPPPPPGGAPLPPPVNFENSDEKKKPTPEPKNNEKKKASPESGIPPVPPPVTDIDTPPVPPPPVTDIDTPPIPTPGDVIPLPPEKKEVKEPTKPKKVETIKTSNKKEKEKKKDPTVTIPEASGLKLIPAPEPDPVSERKTAPIPSIPPAPEGTLPATPPMPPVVSPSEVLPKPKPEEKTTPKPPTIEVKPPVPAIVPPSPPEPTVAPPSPPEPVKPMSVDVKTTPVPSVPSAPPPPTNVRNEIPKPPVSVGSEEEAKITAPPPPGAMESSALPRRRDLPKRLNPGQLPVQKTPFVITFNEEEYVCKGGESYESLSKDKYLTQKYAEALKLYNRHDALVDPQKAPRGTTLQKGDVVIIPDLGALEARYARFIEGYTPLPNVTARRDDIKSERTANSTVSYIVQGNGETMREIARKMLGDGERWVEISKLNPAFRPSYQVPGGSNLRLPADAKVRQ